MLEVEGFTMGFALCVFFNSPFDWLLHSSQKIPCFTRISKENKYSQQIIIEVKMLNIGRCNICKVKNLSCVSYHRVRKKSLC